MCSAISNCCLHMFGSARPQCCCEHCVLHIAARYHKQIFALIRTLAPIALHASFGANISANSVTTLTPSPTHPRPRSTQIENGWKSNARCINAGNAGREENGRQYAIAIAHILALRDVDYYCNYRQWLMRVRCRRVMSSFMLQLLCGSEAAEQWAYAAHRYQHHHIQIICEIMSMIMKRDKNKANIYSCSRRFSPHTHTHDCQSTANPKRQKAKANEQANR